MIEFTAAGEMKYIHDGEVLRVENRIDKQKSPEILTQLEQIRNLKWVGQNNNQNLPIGKWNMIWRGEKQIYGGLYNDNGEKEGYWVEPYDKYWNLCQIYVIGIYNQGFRQGQWIYQQAEKIIGGGLYNKEGQKEGLWIELHQNYDRNCQVIFQGVYQNNHKIGIWIYQFYDANKNNSIKIIGGKYIEDGIKHGKWIDLIEDFDDDQQFLYVGDYYYGKKQGIWNAMQINFRQGCGVYDENEQENGFWVQLKRNQMNYYHHVKSLGQYVHGIKVGTWNISFGNQFVGKGAYNEEGKKYGKWIQLSNYSQFDKMNLNDNPILGKLVTFVGEYTNGKKSGYWQIKQGNIIIGGGLYDDMGYKNGKWNELSNFKLPFFVIQIGEYNKGFKQGRWEILLNKHKGLEKIGGGIYDTQGMKHGKWISLHDNFNHNCKVLDVGQYDHGIKQGRWDIKTIKYYEHDVLTYNFWPKDTFYKIAGGNYQNGEKNGKWIDLDENYNYHNQILYEGEFYNDLKQGKWEMMKHHNSFIKRIGGGQYNQDGLKHLNWIELDKNRQKKLILVEYQNGIKISIENMQTVI
ncbi:unnamed protein product [Paramecium pentaurelia]|uniref:Uncharacterized protein n=1 Tax=Paramecium pentaurelia TaxID=43138 RepID=A0A8S1SSG4_9CILI|nr:unnamed protein product [Paramecium pentaurelia]